MRLKTAGLTAFLVLSWSSFAAAGPVADAGAEAERLHAAGKTVEALEALSAATDAIWGDGALAFRSVAVVDAASGFGLNDMRADATFKPDQKLTVYVEPVGFGYGDGTVAFTADLALENATGQVLNETSDVFSIDAPFAEGRREFYMTLTFDVPFLRPGDYTAIFTVHDKNSDKSGSFDVPFSVSLPAAE